MGMTASQDLGLSGRFGELVAQLRAERPELFGGLDGALWGRFREGSAGYAASIWARPALAPEQRSLATVAMLTALGREHELAIHVRMALRNGVTAEQLVELALHATVYCGFPAAVDMLRLVEEAVAELQPAT
jgi:alkylhydroperoxidase/carboxymuconolactone decarboxylase family protein YurZ